MYCSKCGEKNNEGANFCQACGTKLLETKIEEIKVDDTDEEIKTEQIQEETKQGEFVEKNNATQKTHYSFSEICKNSGLLSRIAIVTFIVSLVLFILPAVSININAKSSSLPYIAIFLLNSSLCIGLVILSMYCFYSKKNKNLTVSFIAVSLSAFLTLYDAIVIVVVGGSISKTINSTLSTMSDITSLFGGTDFGTNSLATDPISPSIFIFLEIISLVLLVFCIYNIKENEKQINVSNVLE